MVDIGRVGIIGGAGWLGMAIAKALIRSNTVAADRLLCSYRSRRPDDDIGCGWTSDNEALVEASDVIILSVRPADWKAIEIDARDKLVISVMAGVTVENIKRRTGSSRVARALPNAATEAGASYTPCFLATDAASDQPVVVALFESCGMVDLVAAEDHIDYFTAMSGSGAAFPALLADAMMQDAVARGIPQPIARRAAQQVLIGAGKLQDRHGTSPTDTVRSFVDYQGTTAAGLVRMQADGFTAIVSAGLEAAYRKALSLSET